MIKHTKQSLFGTVETICKRGTTMLPGWTAMEAYVQFEKETGLCEICIVDEKNRFRGMVTRAGALQTFGGLYGYNLYKKAYVCEIMNAETI